jgi:hypothetical protein
MIGCLIFVSAIPIFFGVILLLENLGIADGLVSKYWPLILIVLGIGGIVNVLRIRARFRGRWPPDTLDR